MWGSEAGRTRGVDEIPSSPGGAYGLFNDVRTQTHRNEGQGWPEACRGPRSDHRQRPATREAQREPCSAARGQGRGIGRALMAITPAAGPDAPSQTCGLEQPACDSSEVSFASVKQTSRCRHL